MPYLLASFWPSTLGTTNTRDTTLASLILSTTTARSSRVTLTLLPNGRCTATTSTPYSPRAVRPPTSTRWQRRLNASAGRLRNAKLLNGLRIA
eukprot:4805652-Pleurochrysis_carterae.AAC.1